MTLTMEFWKVFIVTAASLSVLNSQGTLRSGSATVCIVEVTLPAEAVRVLYCVDFAFLLADDGAGAEQIVAESVWAADGQSATDLGISGEREELLEIVLRKVSDRDLLEISKIITWYSVAPYLFDDARDVIRGIDRDGSNEAEKGRMLMDRWERKVSGAKGIGTDL